MGLALLPGEKPRRAPGSDDGRSRLETRSGRISRGVFAGLCGLWIAARFLPAPSPDPALLATLGTVRIRPASVTGLQHVVLPEAGGPPGAVLRGEPVLAALVDRLREDVRATNEALTREAARLVARVETFPDESAAFRAGGAPIPFFDRAADRLVAARDEADARPGRSLLAVRDVLAQRLEEPAEGYLLEATSRRLDLGRIVAEIESRLDAAEANADAALARFRGDAEATIREVAGPFQRRGPGRILEILLAASIGAALRLARGRREVPHVPFVLAAGPTSALAVLLVTEGTALLPVDPVHGLTLSFLPAAFVIGWAGSAGASRWVRRPVGRPVDLPSDPPPARRASIPRRSFVPTRPEEPRPDGPEAKLPFFRKSRRGR